MRKRARGKKVGSPLVIMWKMFYFSLFTEWITKANSELDIWLKWHKNKDNVRRVADIKREVVTDSLTNGIE